MWWRVRKDEPPHVMEQELREADKLRCEVLCAFGFENKAAVIVLMERITPEERDLLTHLVSLVKFTANEIRGVA